MQYSDYDGHLCPVEVTRICIFLSQRARLSLRAHHTVPLLRPQHTLSLSARTNKHTHTHTNEWAYGHTNTLTYAQTLRRTHTNNIKLHLTNNNAMTMLIFKHKQMGFREGREWQKNAYQIVSHFSPGRFSLLLIGNISPWKEEEGLYYYIHELTSFNENESHKK